MTLIVHVHVAEREMHVCRNIANLRPTLIDSEPEIESLAVTLGCEDITKAEQLYVPASASRR